MLYVPFCHLSMSFNPSFLGRWPRSHGLHLAHFSFFHLLIILPSHYLHRLMKPFRNISQAEGVYWALALASPFCRIVRDGTFSISGMPSRALPLSLSSLKAFRPIYHPHLYSYRRARLFQVFGQLVFHSS
jgi:hypothetical protein